MAGRSPWKAKKGHLRGSGLSFLPPRLGRRNADDPGVAVRYLSFEPVKGSIFRRVRPGVFGDASEQSYFIDTVSRLRPEGPGAKPCLLYPESPGAAAVQYDGSAGGGKVVCFGFPFECVSSAKERASLMAEVLRFFANGRWSRPNPRIAGGRG